MVYAGLATIGLMLVGFVLLAILAVALGIDVQDPEQQQLVVFAVFALEALMIPPVWWWSVRKYGASPRILGLRGFRFLRGLALVAVGLAAILAINVVWAQVMERFGLEGQPDLVPVFGEGLGGFISALFVAAVVAPIAEELFFRGFLYAGLRDRWGLGAGLIVSSVLFGLIHLTPGVILPIILMGAIFAVLFELTDSVWPPILLHALVNGLAVVGLYASTAF
jgi:uncharacterized protein